MSVTILGPAFTRDGLSAQHYIGPDWGLRLRGYAVPSLELRSEQPSEIKLNVAHDPDLTIGRVVALHRSQRGDCWALAEAEDDRLLGYEGPLWFSPGTSMLPGGYDVVLEHLALTDAPATVALQPVELLPGNLRDRGGWEHRGKWVLDGLREQIVSEATEQLRQRRRDDPIIVGGETFTRDGRRLASLNEHERWELMEEQAEERKLEHAPYDSFRWRAAGVIRVS